MCNHEWASKKRERQRFEPIDRSSSDWENIPYGPLIEIAERLPNFEDFVVLHLICTRWTSVLQSSNCKFLGGRPAADCGIPQVPWLILADYENVQCDKRHKNVRPSTPYLKPCSSKRDNNGKSRGKAIRLFFYSLSWKRVSRLVFMLPPEFDNDDKEEGAFKNYCCFSSNGWFLVVRKGLAMSLHSPFCSPPHNFIPLPGPQSLGQISTRDWDRCVKKFALSASPSTKSYTVMIVYDIGKVAMWRTGDKYWTLLEHYPYTVAREYQFWPILDVTPYRGEFYALNYRAEIFTFYLPEEKRGHPEDQRVDDDKFNKKIVWRQVTRLFPEKHWNYLWRGYLVVESSSENDGGKLLVVLREPRHPKAHLLVVVKYDHPTVGFRVLEIGVPLNRRDRTHVQEVKSLGNKSLFVGRSQSLCIEMGQVKSIANHPEDAADAASSSSSFYYGMKPNCIYFTDDRSDEYAIAKSGKGKDLGVYNMADGSIDHEFQGLSLTDASPLMWVEPRT